MTPRAKSETVSALAIEFVFYGFIGWAYETILTSIVWGRFAERGWLHLPICPIYGFCAMALLLIFRKEKSVLKIFVFGTLLTTAAELAASYLLDYFTEKRLWDYYGWKFNFDGRIALGSSLIFGVLCVLLVKLLHPAAKYVTDRMSGRTLKITAAVLIGAILIDVVILLW